MDLTGLLIFLLIGAVAGWLAGAVMKGRGFGLIGNVIAGVVGSFVGGWLFKTLNISIGSGVVSTIVTSAIGAIVVLLIVGMLRRAS